MISKKGYCITVKEIEVEQECGGIFLPERRTKKFEGHLVFSTGIGGNDLGFSEGDVVACETDCVNTVSMNFNGREYLIRKNSTVLAVLDNHGKMKEQSPFIRETIKDMGICAYGQKVIIDPEKTKGYYKCGGIFITYERRELARVNYGTVMSVSGEVMESTGLKPGMVVMYDYHSTYGHMDGFDVTNEENVIAILTEEDVRTIEERG